MNVSANVRIPVHMECEVVERNGEHYVQVNNIRAGFQILGDFKMDINVNTLVPDIIKGAVNEHANSNWRQLKPILEKETETYLHDIVYKAVTPIFENIPIRDFFLCTN